MKCPRCGYEDVPADARYCPNCSQPLEVATRIDIRPEVKENLGRVIGVETQSIHGDVYGGDIYEVQVYALSEAGRTASWERFLQENTPPYKFLSPYTARDRVLFKGRDTEIEQVVRRIGQQRLLVVHGPAGVGKTSLLAAGVIPDLIQNGALVLHLQDYREPVKAIRSALAANVERVSIDVPADASLSELAQAAREATQGTLVIVLDQFEQFLRASDADRQAGFLTDLAGSLQAVGPEFLRFVFVVQEDALGRLNAVQAHLPDLLQSTYQLEPLGHQPAKHAIEDPLDVLDYPVSFVGDLVDEFLLPELDDLTLDAPSYIFPPHLQIVCHWLYEAARERRPPHVDEHLYLDEARGVEGILARYLEETLRTQLAGDRTLAERLLTTMATNGAAQWVSPDALSRNGASPAQVSAVLERLREASLLVQRASNGRREYAFTSQVVAEEVRERLASRDERRQSDARQELEHVWSAWLTRDALATRGQLRFLARASANLTLQPVRALLLLRSAVARDEPAETWLAHLHSDEGESLVQQLEQTHADDVPRPSSRSTLHNAGLLLGVTDDAPPERSGEEKPFGPVAWSAVSHADSVTRRTAALALTTLEPRPYEAVDRLKWALDKADVGDWQRRRRRIELRAVLADTVPDAEDLNTDLSALDRVGVWLWRVRRRLIRDRHRLAGLAAGGAIGAGLGLALLRALTAAVTRKTVGLHFSMNQFFGAILGAFLVLGMLLAEYLLLGKPSDSDEVPAIWRAPLHPDRLPVALSIVLGALFFGLAHWLVVLSTGRLSLSGKFLVVLMGFVAGLGLSLALVGLPWAGRRIAAGEWLARLGGGAVVLMLTHAVFLRRGYVGRSLAIVWPGSTYRADLTHYGKLAWWGRFMARDAQWFNHVAYLDAALVGIVLVGGIGAGVTLAARMLARWRRLVERAGE